MLTSHSIRPQISTYLSGYPPDDLDMTSIQPSAMTSAIVLPPFQAQMAVSPRSDQENAMYHSATPFPIHTVPNTIPFGTTAKKNKKYPYARPRRATTRLAGPKTAVVGETGKKAPLQAVKHRQNFSWGKQQVQQIHRNVSFSKPPQKHGPMETDTHPPSSNTLSSINERSYVKPTQSQTAFVPLKLPRVKIPPVDPSAFCYGRLAQVPPPYVLSHVKQAAPEMLRCASLYRPIESCSPLDAPISASPPSATFPNSHQRPIDIVPSDTVRFGIPAGSTPPPDSVFQHLGGGLEPTHCLAVRPRSRSRQGHQLSNKETSFGSAGHAEEGEVGRMIPIHQMVYASQCAYFPRPVVYVPSDRSASTVTSPFSPSFTVSSSASTSQMPQSPVSPISLLVGLAQESGTMQQCNNTSSRSESRSRRRRGSDASDRTVTSPPGLTTIVEESGPSFQLDHGLTTTTSTRSNNIVNDEPQISASTTLVENANIMEGIHAPLLAPVVDLPLVHVTVPFPSLMAPLHGWLYNPSPPILLASLLDLHCDTAATRDAAAENTSNSQPTIVQRLAALPVHSLFIRMQKIHKLWSNTVALGISDQMLWRVMDRAWDCFVSALRLKGGEAAYEVSLEAPRYGEWSLESQSEVVRKFSMATIRDANSRAGSVSSTSSGQ